MIGKTSTKLYRIIPSIVLLCISISTFAQDEDYDDEKISMTSSFIMALVGGGIFLLGRMLSEVKFISGLGGIIMFIGGFVGVIGVLGIGIVILEAAVSAAVKIALVIGAVILVLWIIKGILEMIKSKEPN